MRADRARQIKYPAIMQESRFYSDTPERRSANFVRWRSGLCDPVSRADVVQEEVAVGMKLELRSVERRNVTQRAPNLREQPFPGRHLRRYRSTGGRFQGAHEFRIVIDVLRARGCWVVIVLDAVLRIWY